MILIFPLWLFGYLAFFFGVKEFLGLNPQLVAIRGTGSMYPTFPKSQKKDPKEKAKELVAYVEMFPYPQGLSLLGRRYFNYRLKRGDIVYVENEIINKSSQQTYGTASGWVKRIIALEGDTVELKSGIVYLNDQPLAEPYTAKPRSTFGQQFLRECKKITVPRGKIFIMGDNRKGSSDSREIGFVDIADVKLVLPLEHQMVKFTKYWRKTDNDFQDEAKIRLDKRKYLELLNQKRRELGISPLRYQEKLEISAKLRGQAMIKFNDLSFEATISGYTMKKAMNEAGYDNIIWGETLVEGYLEVEELIEYQTQFPRTVKFLIDPKFQEFGIAEIEGKINNCPTNLIVSHFAGYVPPNYPREVVDGWERFLNGLIEIRNEMNTMKQNQNFYEKYQKEIDDIHQILEQRIQKLAPIVEKIRKNLWLSEEEEKILNEDRSIHEKNNELLEILYEKIHSEEQKQ
ncbi:MAG: signal peptidase I [Patescibacteria group bacterium]|nr:signal peptidase I [Patescibacteria group bacterium]